MNEEPRPTATPPSATPPAVPPATTVPVSAAPPPVNALTPEEQMALFEKELKENDWGHQPC